jgi:hypothetical protein
MTNPMITIHNVQTNEIVEREMTQLELAQFEIDNLAAQTEDQAKATKAAERAALLEKLGITAEEAALLLS